MIDMQNQMITLQGKCEPILRWAVWFTTVLGLTDNIDLAISESVRYDVDPKLMIAPVPVAISETMYEVKRS